MPLICIGRWHFELIITDIFCSNLIYLQLIIFRDDYALISSKAVKQYTKPVIREAFCFIDPKKCSDRFVNAFAWHPTMSGIFVASYTYKTLNTFAKGKILIKS